MQKIVVYCMERNTSFATACRRAGFAPEYENRNRMCERGENFYE